MHGKISYMLRNVIIKTLKLFNPPSSYSTKAYFVQAPDICTMVSSSRGRVLCFSLSICVAFCFEYILSICMKYMDKLNECVNQNVNLVLIGQHSN